MAVHFKKHYPEFDTTSFIAAATKNLDLLELKERTDRITKTMIQYFPPDFEKAGDIILSSLGPPLCEKKTLSSVGSTGITGWAIMPLVHYVGLQGHGHFELSMTLLKEMTKRASSEFGIRFFLVKSPEKTLKTFHVWALDEDLHVRRLVSEGSRPRLPWAMRLPMFIKDPSPVIALLEILKDDGSEYVRRSVANNLNDIAKDHPDIVATIASKWMKGASKERKKLIRHGCRTLVKKGHQKTLKVFGFNPPDMLQAKLCIKTPRVIFGGVLSFTLSLNSGSNNEQLLVIDYIVHHQKSTGKTSPKVFKWKTATLLPNTTLRITKKHGIKKITTRRYYAGLHMVEIMINGVSFGKADFQLVMPDP